LRVIPHRVFFFIILLIVVAIQGITPDADDLADVVAKIDAYGYIVDVADNSSCSERPHQLVIDAVGDVIRVAPSVRDKDSDVGNNTRPEGAEQSADKTDVSAIA
jgi:hypothetical protein